MATQRHNSSTGEHGILSFKIPAIYVLGIAILVAAGSFLIARGLYAPVHSSSIDRGAPGVDQSGYMIRRLMASKFIRPLISAKPVDEYIGYSQIKNSVLDVIQFYKSQGLLASASLYLRDFDKSNWTAIDPTEKYNPGSILKIPVLMTFLKYEEDHPGSLDSTMQYTIRFRFEEPKHQSIVSKQIQFGKSYSRRELLRHMIEYSDNNATALLWMVMDKDLFARMFEELGMSRPDMKANNIPLSVQECSLFMESLFNATYLNIRQSEFAVDLLSKSTFSDGIVKGIPVGKLLIAHKFGEAGTDTNKELHETALLYIEDRPYLITIMTRGQANVEYSKLSTVIQEVSRTIYYGVAEKDHE